MPSIFHMPAIFPEIFFLAFFAPLLLRVGIAILFLDETRHLLKNKNKRWLSILPAILGLAVVSGFLTQPAALSGIVYSLVIGKFSPTSSIFKNNLILILSIAIFLSLFITGPGAMAFDLPY